MEPTAVEVSADPENPKPGDRAILTITVSGSKGNDHYGIKDARVDLKVTDSPAGDVSVDPASATTDASGAATALLLLSKIKGRNAVTATVGTITTEFAIDTLVGTTGTLTRSRHSGVLDSNPAPATPRLDPVMLFTGAVLVLIGSFAIPYRRRLVAFIRTGRAPRTPYGASDSRARRTAGTGPPTAAATRPRTRSAASASARGLGWKASSGPGKKT